MKIKYLLLMAVVFCEIKAERESVFKRQPCSRPQYYDKEETCQKVNLYGQLLLDNLRGNLPSAGRGFEEIPYGCHNQIERATKINLLKREIANREQFKARFNKLNMCNACQCMDWQIEDLIIELAYLLGVDEMKE